MAAPAAEQHLHAVEHLRFVVDAEDRQARERAHFGRIGGAAQWCGRNGWRDRNFDGKARAAPRFRFDVEFMVEHAGDTLDDRQAETQPARYARTLIEPVKFEKDFALFGFRNADAGVDHIDPNVRSLAPAADQHASLWGIFDGVGNEVLQQPAQQPPVRPHRQRR
jgi:hypothetical protein